MKKRTVKAQTLLCLLLHYLGYQLPNSHNWRAQLGVTTVTKFGYVLGVAVIFVWFLLTVCKSFVL